jgi:ribonuclease BN (tRNA processing enzyme)
MIAFMKKFYGDDISYRMERSPSAKVDPDSVRVREVSGGEKFSVGAATVTTTRVNHTIHTVAYRVESGGKAIVISGDLTWSPSLSELARGADVLVMDSGVLPDGSGNGGRVGRVGASSGGNRAHPSLAEVARMASDAGVKCLVLTHINQTSVDVPATLELFRPLYSGTVVVGADLTEVDAACAVSSRRVAPATLGYAVTSESAHSTNRD